jgi:hypothetical protein
MAISGLTLTLEEHNRLQNENALRFANDWIKSIETNNSEKPRHFQRKRILETTINVFFAGELPEFSDYVSNHLFRRLEQVINEKNIGPYIKLKEHAFKLINNFQ